MTNDQTIKGTILVIEDNEINMLLFCDLLEFHKFNIIKAFDGVEALDKINKHTSEIDLILLDIKIPKFDGFQLLKHIKTDPSLKKIPVIIVSAHVMEEDRRKALELGCNSFLDKPIDITLLEKTVFKYCQNSDKVEV